MQLLTVTLLCALAAVTSASQSLDYISYPAYNLAYSVSDPHTGDVKGQWEKRDGDKVIGEYRLNEPDGTIRVVKYRASDKTGFDAKVERIGLAIHPSPKLWAPIGWRGDNNKL